MVSALVAIGGSVGLSKRLEKTTYSSEKELHDVILVAIRIAASNAAIARVASVERRDQGGRI